MAEDYASVLKFLTERKKCNMSVNLKKGQKVELRKDNGASLHKVMVGLGWDEAEQKRGLFSLKPQNIDCDASAFVCTNGRLTDASDIVYFGNLKHKTKAVCHQGDNLTGAGEGDDEQILVNLDILPAQYDKVIFVVNIYQAMQRKQHFGLVRNAFIRICDAETNKELCRYNLSENYDGMTAMVFGELYRHNQSWKFNAVGQPTKDNDIKSLAQRFI